MKKLLYILHFLMLSSLLTAQESSYKIPLKYNFANDFEFIRNDNNFACLYFDQGDRYDIILLDSNYRVLAEFRDRFYTVKTPQFIGSIAKENKFELFFKRFEEDVLLVLIVDVESKQITRIKDYKITDIPGEKVIFTGSNFIGDKMITVSIAKNNLIYKNHLPGQKFEKTIIGLSDDDKTFIEKNSYYIIKEENDSLILFYKIEKVNEKNPRFKVYNIDLKNKKYKSVDFKCDCKKRQRFLNANIFNNIVFLENCNKKLILYNRLNGKKISEISVDMDSVINNSEIDILRYGYDYSTAIHPEYEFLEGEDRKVIRSIIPHFHFVEVDSTHILLKIAFVEPSYNFTGRIIAYLPFDWEKKEVVYKKPEEDGNFIEKTVYEYDIKRKFKTDITNYFLGFNDNIAFGYLVKKPKQFVIEIIEEE